MQRCRAEQDRPCLQSNPLATGDRKRGQNKMKNKIFEGDVKGLKELQEGKPKYIIIRELLQNAMDEPITTCNITLSYEYGKAKIRITDDSPVGFRNLTDAYTLFADTYKRQDATKRGRFNFGEKQVICLCDYARIISTTGGVEFNVMMGERNMLRKKVEAGSEVYVEVRMTQDEYKECYEYCKQIIAPEGVCIKVSYSEPNNSEKLSVYNIEKKIPHISFNAKLHTELKENGKMKKVMRETIVNLHKKESIAYIYEIGIPVCEIDCDYSIDVQQKIPLSTDRDKVDAKYLKNIYGEVLNQTHQEIKQEQSSNLWVREATTSERASIEAKRDVIVKRFGEKAAISNPFDPIANDDALAGGYNIVHGSEMSKEEWDAIKSAGLMQSTTAIFGRGKAPFTIVQPNEAQRKIETFIKKIALEMLAIKKLNVQWIRSPEASTSMDFGNTMFNDGKQLRINLSRCPKIWWDISKGYVCEGLLDIIIHELGHSAGHHTEASYHECITELGSRLTIKAIEKPEWFNI